MWCLVAKEQEYPQVTIFCQLNLRIEAEPQRVFLYLDSWVKSLRPLQDLKILEKSRFYKLLKF